MKRALRFEYSLDFLPAGRHGLVLLYQDKRTKLFTDKDGDGVIEIFENADSNEVLSENHYYPFGMNMNGAWMNNQGRATNYKYNGKELNQDFGLDWYDYGARWYDASIGRWNAVDPMAVLYLGHSLYSFVLGNPTNAIDPDGQLVIFINGNHYGSGGSSRYWGVFSDRVRKHFHNEKALYFDGSLGGYAGIYSLNDVTTSRRMKQLSPGRRRRAGYDLGKRIARQIIESLGTGETIKLITHSMGGTFGRGFAQALEEVAEEMKITDRKLLTLIADFDPFQAKKLKDIKNVFIQQFIHDGILADQEDENADEIHRDNSKKSHSILTFLSDVSKLKEGTYIYNNETKEWECTNCQQSN